MYLNGRGRRLYCSVLVRLGGYYIWRVLSAREVLLSNDMVGMGSNCKLNCSHFLATVYTLYLCRLGLKEGIYTGPRSCLLLGLYYIHKSTSEVNTYMRTFLRL